MISWLVWWCVRGVLFVVVAVPAFLCCHYVVVDVVVSNVDWFLCLVDAIHWFLWWLVRGVGVGFGVVSCLMCGTNGDISW